MADTFLGVLMDSLRGLSSEDSPRVLSSVSGLTQIQRHPSLPVSCLLLLRSTTLSSAAAYFNAVLAHREADLSSSKSFPPFPRKPLLGPVPSRRALSLARRSPRPCALGQTDGVTSLPCCLDHASNPSHGCVRLPLHQALPRGGRNLLLPGPSLARHALAWRELGPGVWMLQVLESGFRLPWVLGLRSTPSLDHTHFFPPSTLPEGQDSPLHGGPGFSLQGSVGGGAPRLPRVL